MRKVDEEEEKKKPEEPGEKPSIYAFPERGVIAHLVSEGLR
jgi:hypothetical protein